MFERYTEKARRVIFFARYEASQYGSPSIESEHLLLGLCREDRMLLNRFVKAGGGIGEIRSQIERHIKRGERISTSVEMPLSDECRKIFTMAGQEADSLAHRHVGTEHLLIAILWAEQSLASRVLREKGLSPQAIREEMAKISSPMSRKYSGDISEPIQATTAALEALNSFLAGLKFHDWERLSPFFAEPMQFVDAAGKRWKGREEIEKKFEDLFAPYAKKNVTFLLESTDVSAGHSCLASVLWENVTLGVEGTRATHRMTIVLAPEREDWAIFLIQVTPVLAL